MIEPQGDGMLGWWSGLSLRSLHSTCCFDPDKRIAALRCGLIRPTGRPLAGSL